MRHSSWASAGFQPARATTAETAGLAVQAGAAATVEWPVAGEAAPAVVAEELAVAVEELAAAAAELAAVAEELAVAVAALAAEVEALAEPERANGAAYP